MSFYYIYKITQGPTNIATNLEKIDRYDNYKSAKQNIRQLRNEQQADEKHLYKIIFAESELQAEEMLMEKREAPIVMEWEK
jgi:translation initiation factor IF-2